MDLFAAHERSNSSTSPLDGNDPLRDADRDISLTQISHYVGTTPLAEHLPVFELPLADRRWFWGRQDLLDKLEKAWRSHATVTLTKTLAGMGGVGKSQLAAQFAYRHRGARRGLVGLVHPRCTDPGGPRSGLDGEDVGGPKAVITVNAADSRQQRSSQAQPRRRGASSCSAAGLIPYVRPGARASPGSESTSALGDLRHFAHCS